MSHFLLNFGIKQCMWSKRYDTIFWDCEPSSKSGPIYIFTWNWCYISRPPDKTRHATYKSKNGTMLDGNVTHQNHVTVWAGDPLLIWVNRFHETSISDPLVNTHSLTFAFLYIAMFETLIILFQRSQIRWKAVKITRMADRPVISWSRQSACATAISDWLYRRKCLSCNYQISSCICNFIRKKNIYLNDVHCISEEIHTLYYQNSHYMYDLWRNANHIFII